ncbi:MAG: proline--tRNA ligase [Candidatus Aureabacteria bacterium]|nr:proline--tRNA ligase [Candidatus Auribacterota bacterium]
MRWSKALIPTLKQSPAEAEVVSHKLMIRAGMIRKLASGIYSYMPLCLRVIDKVETIVREEMDKAGAQELLMPVLSPSELWIETGRWDVYGKELMRLEDRNEKHFALGPTHEEVITDIARRELRSYKQLPVCLYQIQTKFRDEIRPRFGVMRGREFTMKDAYSFHPTKECLNKYYKLMFEVYSDIFKRCGLKFRAVLADSGAIGGDETHEFMVLASSGESLVLSCPDDTCGYAATDDTAKSKILPVEENLSGELCEKDTPGKKSVEDVSAFLNVKPFNLIKTLVYKTSKEPVVVLVRGDREINISKLKKVLKDELVELADDKTTTDISGCEVGFAGPVGLKQKVKVIVDLTIKNMGCGVTGANKKDKHYVNVVPGKDFDVEKYYDIAMAKAGDLCVKCSKPLEEFRGIEVGQIFKLGAKYSKSMDANYTGEDGKAKPFIMGCYGIGITRTIAAAIEQNNDENGIIWPMEIAPYQVILIGVNMKDTQTVAICEELYKELKEKSIEVLYDDRDQRAGFKFKDADLIGVPYKVVVSEKNLKENKIEIQERRSGSRDFTPRDNVINYIQSKIYPLF